MRQFKMKLNNEKMKKRGFLSMLLGILGASLLSDIVAGRGTNKSAKGVLRAGYGSSIKNKNF